MLLMLRRVCRGCGCTDTDACYDPETDAPCYWATEDPLCSVCVKRLADQIAQESLVEAATEGECDALIAERRRAGGHR